MFGRLDHAEHLGLLWNMLGQRIAIAHNCAGRTEETC